MRVGRAASSGPRPAMTLREVLGEELRPRGAERVLRVKVLVDELGRIVLTSAPKRPSESTPSSTAHRGVRHMMMLQVLCQARSLKGRGIAAETFASQAGQSHGSSSFMMLKSMAGFTQF